jgi:ABC-type cobalamin/Fe3+-siderophores transport system ATPase subunit
VERVSAVSTTPIQTSFTVSDLSVTLDARPVLNGVTFSIPRGAWLSIIGPNGAGKSSLLKAIVGIATLKEGSIWLGEKRLDTLPQRERACYVAYVPQRFEPTVPFSVKEFLSLSLYAQNDPRGSERIDRALQVFRLESFAQRVITKLSVGELQRVMLAAACAQGSELLLLDEPSSALDAHETVRLFESLRELRTHFKKTVLFISHDLGAALTVADTVLVLDKGALRYQGAPDFLLRSGDLQKIFNIEFDLKQQDGRFSVQLPL